MKNTEPMNNDEDDLLNDLAEMYADDTCETEELKESDDSLDDLFASDDEPNPYQEESYENRAFQEDDGLGTDESEFDEFEYENTEEDISEENSFEDDYIQTEDELSEHFSSDELEELDDMQSEIPDAEEEPVRENKSKRKVVNKMASSKNAAEKAISNLTNNEEIDKAIGSAYRAAKRTIGNRQQNMPKKKKKPKKDKYKHGSSQEETPIAALQNGIIRTKTGMYVKILEILPVNFWDKSISEQDDIARCFGMLFDHGPASLHMKCIVDKNNPSRLIAHIKEACENELAQRGISKKVIDCAQDVINKIKNMSENSALTKRYFISWKYEGKSSDIEDIIDDMYNTKVFITNAFYSSGNTIVEYDAGKETLEMGEILYYCLNRKTCREETLVQRITRINNDVQLFNKTAGKKLEPYDCDYLSPKGLYFVNNEYLYQDGQYKTFFALKSNGHPYFQDPGWIDFIAPFGDGTEIDIYTERKNKELMKGWLESYCRRKTVSAKEKIHNQSKQSDLFGKVRNASVLVNGLNNGEEMYDVYIQITIAADSIRELRTLRTLALKDLNKRKLYVEPAYANVRSFYKASLPLMEVPRKIFLRNKRNYLTSSLEALYMATAFEMCDHNGFVLGENIRGNIHSTVAIDPFNTSMFTNANMSIFGMTGSGKTFCSEILARSMRVSGQRIFFILPMKAHEHIRGCKEIDGTYISLYPGSEQRINICEIWPEMNIDKDILEETITFEECWLTKKITFLLVWLDLNLKREPMTSDELDLAEEELYALYKDFGITKDNNSIYYEDGTIKPMPYIGDIYDRFHTVKELARVTKAIRKYVFGPCSNLNGPTNVDLTNKYIVFNVDEKNIPEDLLGAFMLIAVETTYSLVKQNRLYKDTIIIDETWRLIKNLKAGELVHSMIKIIRGYGASLITLTQDIRDYVQSQYGSSIISGSAIKLIMYLEPTEANLVASQLGLSSADVKRITRFRRGQAMLLTNKEKVYIEIKASEKEDRDFTTDPNRLRMYALKDAEMENVN